MRVSCSEFFGSQLNAVEVISMKILNKSPVVIENCVKSVSDGEHSAALELCPDGVLDMIVCGHVHGRRGFVQHQNAGLPEQRSGQADQLALTHTETRYIMGCVEYHRYMDSVSIQW